MTICMAVLAMSANCVGLNNDPSVPDPPTDLTAVAGNGSVALSWMASASDGGSAILRYEVSKDGGVTWETASKSTEHTFVGLTNRTEYTFKVRAVNAAGYSNTATVLATPQNPNENKLGGIAPYNEAKDWLIEQMFKELSFELVTKRYRNDVWRWTERRIFDAKGGNFHIYQSLLDADNPGELIEGKSMYQKTGNQYLMWDMNYRTGKWDGPFTDNAKDLEESIIYFFGVLWGPFPVVAADKPPLIEFTTGSKTVAGRECEKYIYPSSMVPVENFFWVDKANGLLMEYLLPNEATDMEEYQCVRFATSGVTFPSFP